MRSENILLSFPSPPNHHFSDPELLYKLSLNRASVNGVTSATRSLGIIS